MDAKHIANQLRKGQTDLGTLPETIKEALLVDPLASAQYIDERLTKVFANRSEIGEHKRAFMEVSGITAGNLTQLHELLNLKTQKTALTKDREKEALRVKNDNLKRLDAVTSVILGYGSPQSLAPEYEVSHMQIYRNTRRELGKEGIAYTDLRSMSTPQRKALALKVEKRRKQEIDKAFEGRIPA